jgi:hypothetical protein
LQVLGKGTHLEAAVRNISAHGIGLLLPERHPAGTLLHIELRRPDGSSVPVPALMARITNVADRPTAGEWAAGCALIAELTTQELACFRAEAVRAAASDSRRWVRFTCEAESTCEPHAPGSGERYRARVLEVSPGGVGVLLPARVPPGTLLRLRLPAEMSQFGPTLLVRVVHYLRYGDQGWFLGCEFVYQLEEAELQALIC